MKNNSSLVLKVVGLIFLSFLVCCGDRPLADDVIAVLPQDGAGTLLVVWPYKARGCC